MVIQLNRYRWSHKSKNSSRAEIEAKNSGFNDKSSDEVRAKIVAFYLRLSEEQ